MSIALCDHPDIEHILRSLKDMGYSISPASLRLDDLTPTIVSLLQASGERTLTIAPETGSDRLRRVINKTVTNDEILDRAELIFSSGIENLKLYYMIGLPSETDDDLVAIRDLTLQLRDVMLRHARPRGRIGRIVASVNPLVPKPGTTYQWMPMEQSDVIEQKMKRLRSLVSGIDNVYFNIKSERHSYYQALLSLGDRRVAPAIEAAERNGGQWRRAVQEAGVDGDFYIFRDRSHDAVLPWDIIDGGMKHAFFKSELEKERARRMDAAAQAREGERQRYFPCCRDASGRRCVAARARVSWRRRLRLRTRQYACRIRSRSRSWARSPPCGRSSAKLRLLAVDRVVARRKRDVAAGPVASLPDGESHELETSELAFREVQFRIRQLSRGAALVVRHDLDHHV